VPRLPVDIHRHDGKDPRHQQLLALHELRRGVERLASSKPKNGSLSVAVTTDLRRDLEELLAALDRRTPQIERAGEAAIARAAQALRQEALRRLATLDDSRASGAADADHFRP